MIKKDLELGNQDSGAETPAPKLDANQKTTGEKYYSRLKFATGEVFILFATAVIAYWARYGKKTWYNVFNHLQHGFEWMLSPISKTGDVGKMLAEAGASALVTMHGGNLFSLPMKWFENNKKNMVNAFNRRFGKPGELETGQERLKDEPEQSWGDVIKGRIVAFFTVFAAFFSADVLGQKTGLYHFSTIEERVGRWVAGLTKEGKELGISLSESSLHPLDRKLQGEAAKNKAYRFGKILALDIFATTAALVIWGAVSKISAKKHKKIDPQTTQATAADAYASSAAMPENEGHRFAEAVEPRARAEVAAKAKGENSYADMVAAQEMDKKEAAGIST